MNYYKHWDNFHTISQKIQQVLSVQLILVYIAFAVRRYQPVYFITYVHARYHTLHAVHCTTDWRAYL